MSMIGSFRSSKPNPELEAILSKPKIKRYGTVTYEEKFPRTGIRHEMLKIHMRRTYPSASQKEDYFVNFNSNSHLHVNHFYRRKHVPAADQKKNQREANYYLQYLSSSRGFLGYYNRNGQTYKAYRIIIKRKNDSLKAYYEELSRVYEKSAHDHFLHEMLFVRNIQEYPFPKLWTMLLAFHFNMPEYERILAAIRVVTDYDGDQAPEFHADML
ncbi:unnamed protein product [Caenorhabditis sp. 36 PRJEB53466]|nr:unnamed protein product [Caenorhabditis sp. 36 PRJEB53466]